MWVETLIDEDEKRKSILFVVCSLEKKSNRSFYLKKSRGEYVVGIKTKRPNMNHQLQQEGVGVIRGQS